jgi:hypothetical protein
MTSSNPRTTSGIARAPAPSRFIRSVVYCAAALIAVSSLLAAWSLLAPRRSAEDPPSRSAARPAPEHWVSHNPKYEW